MRLLFVFGIDFALRSNSNCLQQTSNLRPIRLEYTAAATSFFTLGLIMNVTCAVADCASPSISTILFSQKNGNSSTFLDLAVAKSLQSTRTVTDAATDVLTTTGNTC